MDPSSAPADADVAHDFRPFFKVYKDGRVERYPMPGSAAAPAPSGADPASGIRTKDVVVTPETGVSARIWLPKVDSGRKLPLLVHYHGGGFCAGSPFDPIGQGLFTAFAPKANVVTISVDYRLAPESPLPTAHEDAFEALKWIASHSGGNGPEQWINDHADLDRVFLTGESAGANIAHYVATRAGSTGLTGLRIVGSIIVHPFFCGEETDKMIAYMYPGSTGTDKDPVMNPAADPDLPRMAGERVLVCVAERDWLRDRGVRYYETLRHGGWKGEAELEETKGEEHCFHVFKRNEKAEQLLQRMADFINRE